MSNASEHTTQVSPAAWSEWKKACTIERCGPGAVSELALFGRSRLFKPLNKFGGSLASDYCDQEKVPARAWLMMEKHLYAGRAETRAAADGKSYKDLLFATAQEPGEIEGYLSDTFRTVAGKIAFEEGWGARTRSGVPSKLIVIGSLDAPSEADGKTLIDNLEDKHIDVPRPLDTNGQPSEDSETVLVWNGEECQPADDAPDEDDSIYAEPETQEASDAISRQANQLADTLWHDFSEKHRLIMTLFAHGLSRADISRAGLIDCKRSQLYEMVNQLFAKITAVDWGVPLDARQRAFLTRPLIAHLSVLAKKGLETSDKRETILSMVMDAQAPKGCES